MRNLTGWIGKLTRRNRFGYVALVVATIIQGQRLGQDANFDLLNYHIYNALNVVTGRSNDIGVGQLQSWFHPLQDIFLFSIAKFFTPRGMSVLLASLMSLAILPSLTILESIQKGYASNKKWMVLLAALIVSGGIYSCEIGSSMGDVLTVPLVLASVSIALGAQQNLRRNWLVGLLMGAAVGLKLTNIFFVPGFLLLQIWVNRKKLKPLLRSGMGIAVSYGVIGLPWLVIVFLRFKNPLFPSYNHIFRSRHALNLPFLDTRFLTGFPAGAIHRFVNLFKYTASGTEVPFRDPRLTIGLFLSMITLILHRKRPRESVGLALFYCLSVAAWLMQSGIHRYAAVLEVVASILIVDSVLYLGQSVTRTSQKSMKWFTVSIGAVVVLALAGFTKPPNWGRLQRWELSTMPVTLSNPVPDGLIIVRGDLPIGFLAQAFSPRTGIVRPQSNFIAPTENTQLVVDARSSIKQAVTSGKPIYMLSQFNAPMNDEDKKFLAGFNLRLDPGKSCTRIDSPVAHFDLCEAAKL
jgi:hypothetical protein